MRQAPRPALASKTVFSSGKAALLLSVYVVTTTLLERRRSASLSSISIFTICLSPFIFYRKVDRVLINLNVPSEEMELLGVHPKTIDSHQQRELNLSGELLFEVGIPKIFKLKVTSKFQNKIRSDRFELCSTRTNNSAQWIFLKNWVKSGKPFEMRVFCQVPKKLSSENRHLYCDAQANQKGRVICSTYGALVAF